MFKTNIMNAKEWLEVMQKASDFPKGTEILIEKYGEMILIEFINWYTNKYDKPFNNEYKRKLIDEFLNQKQI